MQPPFVPFIPLLLKDLTFIHEGNKTFFNGLVNFEKMVRSIAFLSNLPERTKEGVKWREGNKTSRRW